MNTSAEDIPKFVPQLVVEIPDEDGSPLGFVAIDRVVRDRCSGGIRMTGDVSRAEVSGLANSMSWKFAFMNIPTGGAKSGIICSADADGEEKQRRLALFGNKAGPVLRKLYTTGGDIGVGPPELKIVKRAAGLSTRERPGTWRSGFFTAFGVCATIAAWLRATGRQDAAPTAIIEGYGSVGQPLARLLQAEGVTIVGISTIKGGLYNESGIDLDALENSKDKHGDDCVLNFPGAAPIPPSDLLQQKATVLVPGARPWSIHKNNAGKLKCDAIIPASNIPITPEATAALESAGVAVVPDFVSNSGGTFGCGLINRGFSQDFAKQLTKRVYTARLRGLLQRAEDDGLSLRAAAERIAEENRTRLGSTGKNRLASLSAALRRGDGLRRVSRRLALGVLNAAFQLIGDRVRFLPAALHAAAGEAIYDRVVTESFLVNR
jgi:glutamate dehydrogenase (NAD(P)+)